MSKEDIKEKEENDTENIAEQEAQAQTSNEENAEGNQTEESNDSQLEIQLKEANDKFLRLYSEFDNFRRRTAKEKLEITKNAGAQLIKELLSVVDDFDRAIQHNESAEDAESIKKGFNLIQAKFLKILESKGLAGMDSKGEAFDVDKHEALTNIPAPSDDLKGKVVDVIEKGYTLNEKVLRFAKVVVGQ